MGLVSGRGIAVAGRAAVGLEPPEGDDFVRGVMEGREVRAGLVEGWTAVALGPLGFGKGFDRLACWMLLRCDCWETR